MAEEVNKYNPVHIRVGPGQMPEDALCLKYAIDRVKTWANYFPVLTSDDYNLVTCERCKELEKK